MKGLILILLLNIVLNACGKNSCDEPHNEKHENTASPLQTYYDPAYQDNNSTESKFHPLNEWINCKSMGHFLNKLVHRD